MIDDRRLLKADELIEEYEVCWIRAAIWGAAVSASAGGI